MPPDHHGFEVHPGEPLLLNAPETAKALRISERTLWQLTKDGAVPCVRIGRSVRYDVRDLLVLIDRLKEHSDDLAGAAAPRRVG